MEEGDSPGVSGRRGLGHVRLKQELHGHPGLPLGSKIGSNHMVVGLRGDAHRLVVKNERTPYPSPHWYNPFVASLAFPIGRENRRRSQKPAPRKVEACKRLQQKLTDTRRTGTARERPLLSHEHAPPPPDYI